MRLLIVTQKVDRTDPVLGFFHRWIAEFASVCTQVTVLGQLVGPYDLPSNVRIVSLNKEKGASTMKQIFMFWKNIRALQKEYDAVFVHMTPIWVVLGYPFWLLMRKPVFLWYEARGARWPLKVALHMVRGVFSASIHGLPIASAKGIVTGHGIDTAAFRPSDAPRDPSLIVTVGRITASKRLDVIIDAFAGVPPHMRLRIVGGPVTDADRETLKKIEERISDKHLTGRVEIGALPNGEITPLLQKASVFMHASETSLDKAVLEAMACGCPVVSCADAIKPVLTDTCRATPSDMARVVTAMLGKTPEERVQIGQELRATIERDHGLSRLIRLLIDHMQKFLY